MSEKLNKGLDNVKRLKLCKGLECATWRYVGIVNGKIVKTKVDIKQCLEQKQRLSVMLIQSRNRRSNAR